MMINNLKELVEKEIEYTRNWSISETEWYWNIACVRKSNNINEKNITQHEFEVAIREEFLYDLVFNGGASLRQQMENDYEVYAEDNEFFRQASVELEREVRKVIKGFKISRVNLQGEVYYLV